MELVGTGTFALIAAGVLLLYVFKTYKRNNKNDPFSRGLDSITQDKGEWKKELVDKWRLPVSSTPVHLDLPRLARKIEIQVDGTCYVMSLESVL